VSAELWVGVILAVIGAAYLVAAFLWPERF
jgi:K+-transporting ATPase KdpF subunit